MDSRFWGSYELASDSVGWTFMSVAPWKRLAVLQGRHLRETLRTISDKNVQGT